MERISVALKLVNKNFNGLNRNAQCTGIFVGFRLDEHHHVYTPAIKQEQTGNLLRTVTRKEKTLGKSSSNISVVKSHMYVASTGPSLEIHP